MHYKCIMVDPGGIAATQTWIKLQVAGGHLESRWSHIPCIYHVYTMYIHRPRYIHGIYMVYTMYILFEKQWILIHSNAVIACHGCVNCNAEARLFTDCTILMQNCSTLFHVYSYHILGIYHVYTWHIPKWWVMEICYFTGTQWMFEEL